VRLHGALARDEFFLMYQPTIDLATRQLYGVEALLRWQRCDNDVVQPDEFIPELERSGVIVPVGAWVLEEACRQGAKWHSNGHLLTVAVNVSSAQLMLDRFVADVELALAVSGFDPSMLVLEVTETTLMRDVNDAVVRLGALRSLGVRIAVDDFGTGYSSLAYLRRLPVDVLKIDRSFVAELSSSSESQALVKTLVQLAKAMRLETVAEGIEAESQLAQLLAEGVDLGQGFLFSRPLGVAAIDGLLRGVGIGSSRPKPRGMTFEATTATSDGRLATLGGRRQ
jgi:EAL domain-containing protein (putative c-di-GMP-specific phosphodiesterase class I)